MTVIDIECPQCGSVDGPRKTGLHQYRCEDCEHEFEADDVTD